MLDKCFATGLCTSLTLSLRAPENTCFDLCAQKEYIHSLSTAEKREETNNVVYPKADTHKLAPLFGAATKFILLGT